MQLEWIHILSATVLFGATFGGAFFLFIANRSGNIANIAFATRNVVLSNWLFTIPAAIIQPATGMMLAQERDIYLSEGWLLLAVALYLFAAISWTVATRAQIKMRSMAVVSLQSASPLPPLYQYVSKQWLLFTSLALSAIIAVSYLMVAKPEVALSGLVSHP